MTRSFKLLQTLGTGAFGSVHLAEVQGDEGYVQRLAVKWLHPHLKENADLARRLRDEARLLALLDHDNIVRVHGLTRIDGRLAVLMEPVQGADLARAEGSSVPPRAAVEAVEAVADALRAAWETVPPGQSQPLGVVHRDIKPSNIMVTPRGGVKVMDFGVARATFETREARTRSQQFGTARYMAPERWLDGVAEAASDVFSLGVTLVELVTGTPMERPRLAKDAYAEDLERSLEGLAPWPTLRDLARAMCAHDPTVRPTAAEVVHRCRPLAQEVPGPGLREWAMDWVPRRLGEREGPPTETRVVHEDASGETFAFLPTTERTVTPGSAPSRRSAGWLGVTAVIATGILGWLLWQPSPVGSEPAPPPVAASGPMEQEIETPASALPGSADAQVPPATLVVPVEVPDAERPPHGIAVLPMHPEPPPSAGPLASDPAAVVDERSWAPVTFILEPPDLQVTTAHGPIHHRKAVELPYGVHQLTARDGDRVWRCTVLVDDSFPTWRVDATKQGCVQVH